MNEEDKREIFGIDKFTNLLDSSKIGFWVIEMDNNTGINKMYCNKTMLSLLGLKDANIGPEKVFEHWYTRIHKGYYSYVQKAISKVCSGEVQYAEVQYTWNHPVEGNVLVRCCGTLDSVKNGVFILKGDHQNISDVSQMKLIMPKIDKEIFEWHQETKMAYMHTKCELLDINSSSFENFPEVLVEENIVEEAFKDTFLELFEKVKESKEDVSSEIRLRNKLGKYTWYKITLSKDEENNSLIIGTIENIEQLKETELAYIKGSKFYYALLKETVAYAEINLTKNLLIRCGGVWDEYYKYINKLTYSEILDKISFDFVYEEDREKYINTLKRDNLLKRYEEGKNIIKIETRRIINNNDTLRFEFTANLFKEPYTNDVLALFYLKNNDNYFVNESNKSIEDVLLEGYNTEKILEENLKNYSSIKELFLTEGDIGYLINPETYEILEVNELFCQAFNKTKENVIGEKCFSILYDRDTPCTMCKKAFWKFNDFFVWAQYNKVLNKQFLIKNKLVTYNNKKAMLTFSTSSSKLYNLSKCINIENRNNLVLDCINRYPKKDTNFSNISYLLEFVSDYYGVEYCGIIQNNKKNWELNYSFYKSHDKELIDEKFKQSLKYIAFKNNINYITYFENVEDLIVYSHQLYKIMFENNVSNLIIIPIKRSNIYDGYIICTNIKRNELDLEYGIILSHFILDELTKEKLQIELEYAYYHDKLTGFINRAGYRKYERDYDADSIDNIGCFCFAINELTHINHIVSIEAGDQILKDVSKELLNIFDEKKCFRFNGNEFLVIVENTNYSDFLNNINKFENSISNLGLSITHGKLWSDTENELNYIVNTTIQLRKAENIKYIKLKNEEVKSKRSQLLSEIMVALECNEFEVFLQPKFYIGTNNIAGAEGLIRRKSPDGGYIPPNKFIPLLEDNYLIQYTDLFVFEKIYITLEKLKKEGKKIFPISLNFSKLTLLDTSTIDSIKNIKNKYDLEEKYIEIEVTESIGDIEKQQIFSVIKEIESLGYKVLLDDFGVKYSNLSILSEIHFDGLKLDRSIIKNIGSNKTNDIIIKNIISMCRDLNISSIAEGIETKEQESILKDMNCEIGQGYLYSKPIPIPEFIEKYL